MRPAYSPKCKSTCIHTQYIIFDHHIIFELSLSLSAASLHQSPISHFLPFRHSQLFTELIALSLSFFRFSLPSLAGYFWSTPGFRFPCLGSSWIEKRRRNKELFFYFVVNVFLWELDILCGIGIMIGWYLFWFLDNDSFWLSVSVSRIFGALPKHSDSLDIHVA